MKAKKETKPSQQSEPETEENEEVAGETQLSETEGATKLPLIPQYHIENNQPTTPQPPTTQLFYSEAGPGGPGGGGQTNPMHVIS